MPKTGEKGWGEKGLKRVNSGERWLKKEESGVKWGIKRGK